MHTSCPDCGQPRAAGVAWGQCPQCLLGVALGMAIPSGISPADLESQPTEIGIPVRSLRKDYGEDPVHRCRTDGWRA